MSPWKNSNINSETYTATRERSNFNRNLRWDITARVGSSRGFVFMKEGKGGVMKSFCQYE